MMIIIIAFQPVGFPPLVSIQFKHVVGIRPVWHSEPELYDVAAELNRRLDAVR